MGTKYGKVAVASVIETDGVTQLEVIKDDFEENRKALAVAWIEEQDLAEGEILQIVRLDTKFQKREIVETKVVVTEVEEETDPDAPIVHTEESVNLQAAE